MFWRVGFPSLLSDQNSEGLFMRFFFSKIGNSQTPDCWSTHHYQHHGQRESYHVITFIASLRTLSSQIWSLSGGGSFISLDRYGHKPGHVHEEVAFFQVHNDIPIRLAESSVVNRGCAFPPCAQGQSLYSYSLWLGKRIRSTGHLHPIPLC